MQDIKEYFKNNKFSTLAVNRVFVGVAMAIFIVLDIICLSAAVTAPLTKKIINKEQQLNLSHGE